MTRSLRSKASFKLPRTSIYGGGGSTNGSSRNDTNSGNGNGNGIGIGNGNGNSIVENQSTREGSKFEDIIQIDDNNGSGSDIRVGVRGGGGADEDEVGVGVRVGSELSLNLRNTNNMSSGSDSDLDLQQQQQQQLLHQQLQSHSHSHSQTTSQITSTSTPLFNQLPYTNSKLNISEENNKHDSLSSSTDFPTPNTDIPRVLEEEEEVEEDEKDEVRDDPQSESRDVKIAINSPTTTSQSPISSNNSTTTGTHQATPRKPDFSRRQSLLPHQQTKLIKTLLGTDLPAHPHINLPTGGSVGLDYFNHHGPLSISATMVTRKLWVKRPGASATLVTINEDDLVDDVRDMILKKYANSLGRSFDAPDVALKIVPREQQRQERTLGPEEPMCRTLDAYFPGGQSVDEALVIDVPVRRTPKPSPRPNGHPVYYEDGRPTEAGSEYFPPMPPEIPSPGLQHSIPVPNGPQHTVPLLAHAMSVLTTGHVPALPSPGAPRRHHSSRPRIGRTHTSSPTIIVGHSQPPVANNGTQFQRGARSRTHSNASEKSTAPPPPPPLPTPPAPNQELAPQRVATPPPRVISPRPQKRSKKKIGVDHPSLPAGMLNGAVPPINVLIVEDNIINLKLLEAFMKRLKVRWQTAMNGREAVNKWRGGGFHLVLMDIQLPIMSGLEATKEIRRLERLNSIGVFSSSASSTAPNERDMTGEEPAEGDKLPSTVLFKSPVIIVALTASSLQSDRHEALAAGCNDFLTKPVNFVWLERKVMEWGCMQALIDFDGWRKWKDFSSQQAAEKEAADAKKKDVQGAVKLKKKNRNSMGSSVGLAGQGGSSTKLNLLGQGGGGIGIDGEVVVA
ncbi:putative two-component response regulator SSK1p [Sclerotinia borealis F-4128]|uniref:Putative two-component response regulator SSK1p n=1 Tax=Sclerotinia borealis (strain F-4128) TaxID=1432307 RepID=W9CP27_SCLBF|nr:putative two-component response regulator SSK1p [Sclerotinia borealis F-4128]